ncbi:putative amidoligase enzyme-domain-containing protein [Parachaetomium inaequale]|uniref:Amidoligase enzyme-domain-containing protein n=1 Tax=Parachaetomium inaequale TaxID=2588326 RepID=A0AAN6PBH4_9PEZI|nr:putative amidoligase enzyme-domain-containing protein [Parachaetomium inaequale]
MSAHPSTGLLNPYFGIEIEIFLRLKPAVEENIKEKIRARKRLPDYWKTWDFNLENSQGDQRHEDKKMKQLARVGYAILDLLDQNLGEGHGWGMANDQSLKGDLLTEPSNPRKWWGAEIISPPLAAGSNWRADIKTVFASLGNVFDFWTNDYCSCHVHVSPGPKNNSKYTMSQLMQIAKGALFWEDALKQILPHERRTNRYAGPNWLAVARQEYMSVSCHGWKPVFDKISRLAARPTSTADFAKKMTIIEPDPNHPETRYLSTSFSPLARLGTVEFRRQAGVASAQTAIHRVLLALTLYTSAVNLNFDREGERYRKKHPDENALIDVLCRSLENNLPAKAGWGVDFRAWLEQCASDYESDEEYRRFGEREINEREGNMRRYGTVTLAIGETREPPAPPRRKHSRRGCGGASDKGKM